MKVSLSWLKELVSYELSPEDLANKLSLASVGVKEINSEYIELDLTYNKGDLLSLRGVAREVSAITNSPLLFEDIKNYPWEKLSSGTPVEIEDSELSSLQCVARIENLKVGPSPEEWVKKLEDCGMRSVNNLVDITNLIMLEFGEPLHAFDERDVEDQTIIVRKAKSDEQITTLDHKLRKLDSTDIVLSDTQKPLDVAGVMGGANTEVKDSTQTILLSSSIFNPVIVRRTSRKLGLYSEASKRFQHGLTKTNLLQATAKAINMYQSLGGKLTGFTLKGDIKDDLPTITLSQEKLEKLVGIEITLDEARELLEKLNFTILDKDNLLEVTPPYYRLDVRIEEDVIEEVARIFGYEAIPNKPLSNMNPPELDQSLYDFIYRLKVALKEEGLIEAQSYSFYSTDVLNNIGWAPDSLGSLVKIANPISSETEYMRTTIWQNLLEVVAKNVKKHSYNDIAIFEIGKVYSPQKEGQPTESYSLSIALTNGTANPIEELYAIIKKVSGKTGLNMELTDQNRGPIEQMLFHPNRFQRLKIDRGTGGIAEIHPRIVNRFGIDKKVAVLEITLEES